MTINPTPCSLANSISSSTRFSTGSNSLPQKGQRPSRSERKWCYGDAQSGGCLVNLMFVCFSTLQSLSISYSDLVNQVDRGAQTLCDPGVRSALHAPALGRKGCVG
jgi:hypothetical protein